jgi:pimeloyl-ACP methyl ester carboxylesterase
MNVMDTKLGADMAGFSRDEHVINGVKTVVYSIGSGPEVVFLHGAGTFTGFAFARTWAAQRRVIIPINPNFGESGDEPSLDGIEDYVLHYLDLFDHLRVAKFDLAGFSLGGWLAAEFAVRSPQRIRRLLLIAPAGLVVEQGRAPELSEITPWRCATSPRRRTRRSTRALVATSAPTHSSSVTIRRAIPSSGAGCIESPFRRCCSGAQPIACVRSYKPRHGRLSFPMRVFRSCQARDTSFSKRRRRPRRQLPIFWLADPTIT